MAAANGSVKSDRFGSLGRLAWRTRRREIPFVLQLQSTECGAACLAMVLGYYGRDVQLEEIRDVLAIGRDGTSALALLKTARLYGLRGRGIKLDVGDLPYLSAGSILHWEFNHFVVFEKLQKKGVSVVDPAVGRRFVPLDQFRRSFTGVALVLEPGETFQKVEKSSHIVWEYAKRILTQSGALSHVVVISFLLQVLALAVPVLTGALVDRIVPRSDRNLLFVLGLGLCSIVVFHFLGLLIRAHLLLSVRTYFDTRITLGFLDHLVDLPYAFFQKRAAGDLIMRLNSNSMIRETVTSGMLTGFMDGIMVSLYIIILLAANSTIALLVLLLATVQIGLFLGCRGRYQRLMSESLQAQAKSQGYLVQMLSGIETLKASGAEPRAVEKWSNFFIAEMNASLARGRLSATVDSLMGAVRLGSPLIILWIGGVQVLDGSMTLGTMLALNALAVNILGPLSTLVSTALQLQTMGSYIERIEDVLKTAPEQDSTKVTQAARLRGRITLERVSFSYSPIVQPVIRDVSLDIRPGQKVAIVGQSGAGKTTLAKLMLGLYAPDEGRILYDGIDLAGIDLRSVRSQLGIVTQRTTLFGATIRENIALADPGVSLQQVIKAARLACIHDEIAAMPMGYDTLLMGGTSVSGGQLQRIALARAFVNKPSILLLDEATSELDSITENRIHQNLASLQGTRIIIAHRLSTIADADLILVLQAGELVEIGGHESLLETGGIYCKLVSSQLRSGAASP